MEDVNAPRQRARTPQAPKSEGASQGAEKITKRKPKVETAPTRSSQVETSKYLQKGAERRRALTGRLSNFFSGFSDKVTHGANFVLGSPEMAADKVREIYNGAKEGIAGAYNGLTDAFTRGKERTGERIQATKDKATRLGLSVAASVEDRAVSAWNIPQAWALELGARRAGGSAEKSGARVEQLQQQIDAIQAEILELRRNQEGSVDQMWEKNLQAQEHRERVGYASEALMGLEKRGIEEQKQAA